MEETSAKLIKDPFFFPLPLNLFFSRCEKKSPTLFWSFGNHLQANNQLPPLPSWRASKLLGLTRGTKHSKWPPLVFFTRGWCLPSLLTPFFTQISAPPMQEFPQTAMEGAQDFASVRTVVKEACQGPPPA